MAALSVGRREAAERARLLPRPRARLVIVRQGDDHFVLCLDGRVPRCPEVAFSASQAGQITFGGLVEASTRQQMGIQVSYDGLLAIRSDRSVHEFAVLVSLKGSTGGRSAAFPLQRLTYTEARDRGMPAEELAWLETATLRRQTAKDAASLGPRIRQAFDRSLDLLERNIAREDGGIVGWSQYLDGTVGLLSTAQGLLAYVHAGRRSSVVEQAAATIEKIQNPDGGWQVRRALVGQPSPLSLTESTCYCLWALHEAGRPATGKALRDGVEWLEGAQGRGSGGWRASAREDNEQVSATAAAVRTLALFGKAASVRRGVDWLRGAQQDDGGWAEQHVAKSTAKQQSAPAHTAHAVIAMLAAGVPPTDPDVVQGYDYLERTFRANAEEPWEPTLTNTIVDDRTKARLDYRHFATPWALVALSRGGHDLDDPRVLTGAKRLLGLQEKNGTWRCRLTSPTTNAVWALHDALFALRTLLDAGTKNLTAAPMAAAWGRERDLLQEAVVRLLADHPTATARPRRPRSWLPIIWTGLLTVALAALVVLHFGWFPAIITGLGSLIPLGLFLNPFLAEEYKLWRSGRKNADRSRN